MTPRLRPPSVFRHWRFEPPTELLASARQLPRWRELLQNAQVDGRPVPRDQLFEGNPALKRRLPESVRREDVQRLLRELEDAEKLAKFQKSVKGMRMMPITLESASDRFHTVHYDQPPFDGMARMHDPPLEFRFFDEKGNSHRTVFFYGMRYPPPKHESSVSRVPIGLAASMALLHTQGVKHMRIPGTEFTRARKGVHRGSIRQLFAEAIGMYGDATHIDLGEVKRIYDSWYSIPPRELDASVKRLLHSKGHHFPEHLIQRYYGDMPQRFASRMVKVDVENLPGACFPGHYDFHEIPTSIAEPMIPFMRESDVWTDDPGLP